MAWSSAELSSNELAWAAADKPLLLGGNALEDADTVFWSTGYTQSTAADETDAAGPVTRLHDGYTHLKSYGDATDTEWMVHIDFGAAGVTFDSIAILDHNFGTVGVNNLTIRVSDDDAYTTNFDQILQSSTAGNSNDRLVYLDLKDTGSNARRFSTVQYLRLYLNTSGGASIPQIGELIFGQRVQLKTNPLDPWDPNRLTSKVSKFESSSGVITSHVHHTGRRKIAPAISVHETARISDMETFYETRTDYGTKPFLWVDQPATAPNDAPYMLMDNPDLVGPTQGPAERIFSFTATEQGPNFVSKEG